MACGKMIECDMFEMRKLSSLWGVGLLVGCHMGVLSAIGTWHTSYTVSYVEGQMRVPIRWFCEYGLVVLPWLSSG